MRERLAIGLACLWIAACAAFPGGQHGSVELREGLVRTTLGNGLKVVLIEDHSAPVVALNVWVHAGSADEHPDEWGMAHVFEHMLFKGTERRAVGEIARTVEGAGGNINAFTSYDMTVYHITMAARDAAVGVDVLADAVLHSAFDPAELAKEKEVIVEEIRRGEDSPGRVLFEEMFKTAYTTHPYRLSVIGTAESVRAFTREQLLAFHRRWYVTNNMTFVAAGDFDATALLAEIERGFAEAKPRGDLGHPRTPEPPQTSPRAALVRRDFEQTLAGIAWPITRFEDPDAAYLDLLAMVAGAGDSSRLYRSVKDRRRLVHEIGASSYTPLDPGLFYVDVTLDPDKIETALETIGAELHRLRAFGPSEVELERARTNVLATQVHEKETMDGQAKKYGYFETLARGIEAEAEYLERIRRASVEDLRRVAQKYLVPERANVGALLPSGKRPELDAAALLAALARGERSSRVSKRTELRAGITRYELQNGLRVVVKRSGAVPLVSLRLSWLGGLLVEDERTQGLSSFLAEMIEKGTDQRSAGQIAAEVEGIAGDVGGFAGRNTFGVTGEFLRDSLDTGLELYADLVLHPSFPKDEIEKLREERLAAIHRREDNLATKAFDLFAEALYPDHPYRFPSVGTEKSVRRLTRDALLDVWRRYAEPRNGVLSIVGDVDPDEVVELVANHFAEWSGRERVELPPRAAVVAPAQPRELVLEKKKQQVHVVMGFPGLVIGDPDEAALEVLSQVLSGQGGRLFLELRDKRSLAYSVTAFEMPGVDPGSFGVYIASAPDKLESSISGLRRELQRVFDEPASDDEIRRAKSYLIGTQAVSLQPYAMQASLLSLDELYGLGATWHLDYAKRVEAVTPADLKRVAERVIRLDRPVVAVIK